MTAQVKATVNPAGRLDVLLMRLAETAVRTVEARTGLSIWDGEDGLSGVMQDKLRELKVPDQPIDFGKTISVRNIAESAGFVKRKRARKAVR